jgi:hypothetical protein
MSFMWFSSAYIYIYIVYRVFFSFLNFIKNLMISFPQIFLAILFSNYTRISHSPQNHSPICRSRKQIKWSINFFIDEKKSCIENHALIHNYLQISLWLFFNKTPFFKLKNTAPKFSFENKIASINN